MCDVTACETGKVQSLEVRKVFGHSIIKSSLQVSPMYNAWQLHVLKCYSIHNFIKVASFIVLSMETIDQRRKPSCKLREAVVRKWLKKVKLL